MRLWVSNAVCSLHRFARSDFLTKAIPEWLEAEKSLFGLHADLVTCITDLVVSGVCVSGAKGALFGRNLQSIGFALLPYLCLCW